MTVVDVALQASGYVATATTSGRLRRLTFDGRDLIVPREKGDPGASFHGAILSPWPGRVERGRYEYGQAVHQLPINEPAVGHAIHGFAANQEWRVLTQDASTAELESDLNGYPGYPFELTVLARLALDARGLRVTVETTNVGGVRAPVGLGFHPYLRAGAGTVDDWLLSVPAGDLLDIDDETLLPVARRAVGSTPFDFRARRPIGGLSFSRSYTGLVRDDGWARVEVTERSGSGAGIAFDEASGWVQVYTGDVPETALRRRGVAVEPMTCPPNALVSGVDLVHLAPGARHRVCWRLYAIEASTEQ